MADEAREARPDPVLVLDALRGDRASFDDLVRRHQRAVRAVARAICADPVEAQDLAQEAFIRAWTNLDLLVEPARFGGWVRRIVFACAIDWLRRRPPIPSLDTEALLSNVPSIETQADAILADRQVVTAVCAAIARLPPRYRRPLVLYHLDGLRQDRIAEVLGLAPGTVRSLITRARQALRAEFADGSQQKSALEHEVCVALPVATVSDELLREPDPRELLHICNGHATWRPLEQAGVPGRFKLFVDVLLDGPCPPLWGEAWRELRLDFLTGPGGLKGPDAPRPGEELWDDGVAYALSTAGGVDEIVLWYEHDLYDQLLLVRLLALIGRHQGARPLVSLVSIGEHPEVPAFKGLGQLTPDQLASLFETRSSISEATIALGHDAWTAYTDPNPQKLEVLCGRNLSPLPFLARALRRHLAEYPGVDDGLSRTERNLLTLVGDGIMEPVRVWQQLHAAEDCHYIADSWLLRLLDRLTAAPAPLLVVDGELRLPLTRGQARLSLTPLGEKVLQGRVDWLELAGIDRWLGGVHLDDPGTAWRWDPTCRRLIRKRQPPV